MAILRLRDLFGMVSENVTRTQGWKVTNPMIGDEKVANWITWFDGIFTSPTKVVNQWITSTNFKKTTVHQFQDGPRIQL